MKFDLLNNKEKLGEIFIYGIFGVLTTAISFGSFFALRKVFAFINENILNTISILIAIIFAYFTNRKFVFKSKEKNKIKEFFKFIGSRTFSAIFEIIFFFVLNSLCSIDGMTSKIFTSFIVIVLNYITSKLFVFKIKNNT